MVMFKLWCLELYLDLSKTTCRKLHLLRIKKKSEGKARMTGSKNTKLTERKRRLCSLQLSGGKWLS